MRLLLLAGLVLVVLAPGTALADDYYPGTTPPNDCYGGSDVNVCGTDAARDPLPFTGSSNGWLTYVGAGVVVVGAGLVWVGRRRSDAAT